MSKRAAARSAVLFPGQGEEHPGMARSYVERPGPVRGLLDRASARIGVDVARVILDGGRELTHTEVAQPALVAVSLGLLRELTSQGLAFSAAAGHSLGELSAFSAAGCMSYEEAVDLACARGAAMGRAARRARGGMVALRTMDSSVLQSALAVGRSAGALDVAAHNAPGQWVLSGEQAALAAVAESYTVNRLAVDGPWHSSLMSSALGDWDASLRQVALSPPTLLVVENRSGRAATGHEEIHQLLLGQLTRPVAWVQALRTLVEAGIDDYLLVGPSRILRGLCRENLPASCRIKRVTGQRSSLLEASP